MKTSIPFQGFYNSTHDYQLDQTLDQIFSDHATGCHVDETLRDQAFGAINWHVVHINYAKQYVLNFAELFQIKLEFFELISPKYYNYETDRIFCNISATEVKRIFRHTDKKILERIIAERFTSRDGFISHYPNNPNEWPKNVTEWDLNHVGTLIMAYIETHDNSSEDYQLDLVNDENGFITNLLQDQIPSEILNAHDANQPDNKQLELPL